MGWRGSLQTVSHNGDSSVGNELTLDSIKVLGARNLRQRVPRHRNGSSRHTAIMLKAMVQRSRGPSSEAHPKRPRVL
jgi:hypothetical protein